MSGSAPPSLILGPANRYGDDPGAALANGSGKGTVVVSKGDK